MYVDAPISANELAEKISSFFGVLMPWNTVKSDKIELEVHDNEDFIKINKRKHYNDFVLYSLFVEIEPIPGIDNNNYIRAVSELLEWLWEQGYPAVAACDFENELPKHELSSFWHPEQK